MNEHKEIVVSSLSEYFDAVSSFNSNLIRNGAEKNEELLFRGLITTALKEKGETFAIWTSSIMFAIFHFSPLQLIYPLCFGLILSIVYLRTKNIVLPILLHFINNALSISIQYFSNSSGGEFIHSTATLMYSIITLVIWIVIIRYMFKDFKQYKSNLKALQDNLKQNEFFENATIVDTSTNNTDQKPTTSLTLANDSLNDKILYGSIILMGLIYILLLFA